MNKQELIIKLGEQYGADVIPDAETSHVNADGLFLEFINDDEISAAFNKVPKWYA